MLTLDYRRNKRGFWSRELGKRMEAKRNTPLLGGFKKRMIEICIISMYTHFYHSRKKWCLIVWPTFSFCHDSEQLPQNTCFSCQNVLAWHISAKPHKNRCKPPWRLKKDAKTQKLTKTCKNSIKTSNFFILCAKPPKKVARPHKIDAKRKLMQNYYREMQHL